MSKEVEVASSSLFTCVLCKTPGEAPELSRVSFCTFQ